MPNLRDYILATIQDRDLIYVAINRYCFKITGYIALVIQFKNFARISNYCLLSKVESSALSSVAF